MNEEVVFWQIVLEQIKEILAMDDEIHKLAEELYQQRSLLVMGRGFNYATCLEGALVISSALPLSPIYRSLLDLILELPVDTIVPTQAMLAYLLFCLTTANILSLV